MAKGSMPSWGALLGMLAIAGYQHRDKITELIKQAKDNLEASSPGDGTSSPGKVLIDSVNPDRAKDIANEAVNGVVEGMKKSGLGPIVESWIGKGANEPVAETQLEKAIGGDLIEELSRSTGLSKTELLRRLSRDVPRFVDDATPYGTRSR